MAGVEVGENVPGLVTRPMDRDLQHLTAIVVVFLRLDQMISMLDRLTDFPAVVLQDLNFPVHGSYGV